MISAVRERCAGIDVHKEFVMVSLMWGPAKGEAQWETRRFGTTAPALEELKTWFASEHCSELEFLHFHAAAAVTSCEKGSALNAEFGH
jgi:hypothetical protein